VANLFQAIKKERDNMFDQNFIPDATMSDALQNPRKKRKAGSPSAPPTPHSARPPTPMRSTQQQGAHGTPIAAPNAAAFFAPFNHNHLAPHSLFSAPSPTYLFPPALQANGPNVEMNYMFGNRLNLRDESEEENEEENPLDLLAYAFKELDVTTEIEMGGLNDQATRYHRQSGH
jgi:hypothetical protein